MADPIKTTTHSDDEVTRLRRQLHDGNRIAMELAVRSGAGLHPRIQAALSKRQVTDTCGKAGKLTPSA